MTSTKHKYEHEYILCAAIHYLTGDIHVHQPTNIRSGVVICGHRHCNCIQVRMLANIPRAAKEVQGFVTSKNRFVDRKLATKIAYRAQQIDVPVNDGGEATELFSEDLY